LLYLLCPQAAQGALSKSSARAEELQQQLLALQREVAELAQAAGDHDLEVGLLRAQLASAQAQAIALQAEQASGAGRGAALEGAVAEAQQRLAEAQAGAETLRQDVRAAQARADCAGKVRGSRLEEEAAALWRLHGPYAYLQCICPPPSCPAQASLPRETDSPGHWERGGMCARQ
jgi:hypothetical protein